MATKKESAELMYVQCAYCREWIDVKPGKMNEITHTICPACVKKLMLGRRKKKAKAKKPRHGVKA